MMERGKGKRDNERGERGEERWKGGGKDNGRKGKGCRDYEKGDGKRVAPEEGAEGSGKRGKGGPRKERWRGRGGNLMGEKCRGGIQEGEGHRGACGGRGGIGSMGERRGGARGWGASEAGEGEGQEAGVMGLK